MSYHAFPHTMNLYQKPALGDTFVNRFPVYNYRHTIAAVGGFDTASCDIAIRSRDEGQQFLDQYIGNRVAFYVDNPVEPIWEGFINRMTFDAGGVQYTISLDEMSNRVTVTYTDPAVSATQAQISVAANNTDSQALYGLKQENIDMGYLRSGSGATALRDTIIAQKAWPKSSITRGQDAGMLHIEMLGFYHTLTWETQAITATTANNLGNLVLSVNNNNINGTTFFDNADTTDLAANVTAMNNEHIKREASWDMLLRWQEIGNAASYYVVGITPTLYQTGTRRMYYRVANTDIEYTARQSDGLRIRNLYGQLVPPWTVRPDAGIRVSDMLIGWNGLGDDPAETYIKTITYDANQQTVDYQGDDDTRAEGAFQLKRYGKPIGKRFSATIRRAV
jgi:hypothetical protein